LGEEQACRQQEGAGADDERVREGGDLEAVDGRGEEVRVGEDEHEQEGQCVHKGGVVHGLMRRVSLALGHRGSKLGLRHGAKRGLRQQRRHKRGASQHAKLLQFEMKMRVGVERVINTPHEAAAAGDAVPISLV